MKAPHTLIHALRFIKRAITHTSRKEGVEYLKPHDMSFAVGQRAHQNYPFDVVGYLHSKEPYTEFAGMLDLNVQVHDTATGKSERTSHWWVMPVISDPPEECTWYPVTPIYEGGKIVRMRVQGNVYDVDDLEPYVT